ncbi:MAG: SynChlorMet cassette radical SAM/SPASM protein ScmF [Candidatus Omnitrophota bacterium]|nr:SynChlorMet cassette radical SAM/SPASM protein ScmF [Candidatus Omnitrophota bacterium]
MANVYPLRMLYLYLTKGCNMRCRHCWIAPGFQSEERQYPSLPLELFGQIINEAVPLGLRSVKLTGGEPLLHPAVGTIIDRIREKKLRLTVETNGTLLTPGLAHQLAAAKAFVSVSVDGPTAEVHEQMRGVKGSFEKALEGIRNLCVAGLKPQVIMSLIRANAPYIEQTVRLAISLGVRSMKFNPVLPIARGRELSAKSEILSARESLSIGRQIEESLSKTVPISLIYSFPPAFRSLGSMFETGRAGCAQCNIFEILGVLGDGSYALCGIGETIPELVFGNARQDRLSDIWRDAPMLARIRELIPGHLKGVCAQCLLRNRCLGQCIAQNYYSTFDLTAPFTMCQEAFEQGFFPASRLRVIPGGSLVYS